MHRAEERERLVRLLRSLAESAVKREMRIAEQEIRQRRHESLGAFRATFRGVGEMAAITVERAAWIDAELRRYDETGTSPYLMVNVVVG